MKLDSQPDAAKTALFDIPLEKALENLHADLADGLTAGEAESRLSQGGYNEVTESKVNPLFQFAKKFWGISAWMLELVIILSWYLKNYSDMIVVAGLLVINSRSGLFRRTAVGGGA